MRLVITEKMTAGKRISDILATGKVREIRAGDVPVWTFEDTVVVPLSGHIMDVGFGEKYSSWAKVDVVDLAKAKIQYLETKKAITDTIRKYAKKADEVIIACDYDNEGESIGLEAIEISKSVNPKIKIKRALFSAITKEDVDQAFKKLTKFNKPLAESANARREIDLIWGATLTRFISKAAKKLGPSFLSVGRVQTPTLSLIVEREKKRMKFKSTPYWHVSATLEKGRKKFTAMFHKRRLTDEKETDKIVKTTKGEALVNKVRKTKSKKQPPTPFNTTDFLRAAANIGTTAASAMRAAQGLYVNGFISYPRTDNTVYSRTINLRKILKKLSKIEKLGQLADEINAKKKLEPTEGKKKTKDHPPIHPVSPADKSKLHPIEWKIYELIVRRFLATLSDPSEEERIKVELEIGKNKFISNGFKILVPGWRKYYHYSKAKENLLPGIKEGDKIKLLNVEKEEKETTPPVRYGYSTIIKVMDELNLGTKSTRPSILQKLVMRGYLMRGAQLIPSKVAIKVTEALKRYSPKITDAKMTADLEKEMLNIEKAKTKKPKVVDKSRKILITVLNILKKHEKKIGDNVRKGFYWDPIGKCANCEKGEMRIIKSRKTGKRFVGCSSYPKCRTGWPLPQKGMLTVLPEVCKHCGIKKVQISYAAKRAWKLCPNLQCPTKKDKK